MKRFCIILSFLLTAMCGAAQDIPTFYANINGKSVPAVLIWCDKDASSMGFAIDQPFMENDTQYIRREFHLWKCDNCTFYDTCVNSYYIVPKSSKGHIASVLKTYYVHDPDFSKDTFLFDTYSSWRESFPEFSPEQRNLYDMPRHWFDVHRYKGQYVLTTDYCYGMTFTDSMIVFHWMESWFSNYGEVTKPYPEVYYYEDYHYSPEVRRLVKSRNWLHPSTLVKGLYVQSSLSHTGELYQSLVTPQENLHYFDLIQAKLCELDPLVYDTVDYAAHTDPALMRKIRSWQYSIAKQAGFQKKKTEDQDNLSEPIVVEGVEIYPADDRYPARCFMDTFPEDTPVMFAEEMPEFPGGPDSLNAFLRQNLQWPNTPGCWNGTVLVEFIVEVDGSITHPRVVVSLYKDFDEESIRVIQLMPKWKPARAQGEPVRCYYKIPVTFRM